MAWRDCVPGRAPHARRCPISHLPHRPAPRPPTTTPRGQTISLLLRLPSRNCVPPNTRIQPTPLRVERDRRFFMCYTHLEGVPDLGSAARLMRNSLGGSYVILLGLGSGGLASRDCVPGRARHARRCPNKPPNPPPRAAPADYRPARPDHLPVPAPTILKKACRPTCASSRRRFASSEIAPFSCAILILRAFPILDRRRR